MEEPEIATVGTKGHIVLEHPDRRWTVVPGHDQIKIGTMKSIIEDIWEFEPVNSWTSFECYWDAYRAH